MLSETGETSTEMPAHPQRSKEIALLIGTFIIAICGLVYELLESTISSYLLGDSVYYFSLVIGLFMSTMGLGAWLSRFVDRQLERAFVRLQMGIAVVGGFSALVLFWAFAYLDNYEAFLYLITIVLGAMLGMEIPLIVRILKESFSLKTNLSNVFTLDYAGALIAALLFPLVLVPHLGLMQTGFLFGLFNLLVGTMGWWIWREALGWRCAGVLGIIGGALVLGMIQSDHLVSLIEDRLYQNHVIYSKQTPYQKLILTAQKGRIQFYINGAIQFDTMDEYRYHESLVHPAMHAVAAHHHILIIGGGDGMALREVLRYPDVGHVTLVDLDPAVTTLFRTHPLLRRLNHRAFENPKVTVVNRDAWKYIEHDAHLYDLILIDLPDPNTIALGRLYSLSFYRLIASHLARGGAVVTQATSPLFSREAFWSIEATMRAAGLRTVPYHTYIPSFGEWGFVLAAPQGRRLTVRSLRDRPASLRYIDDAVWEQMQRFPADMAKLPVESNRLSSHKLIYYYAQGWDRWYAR